MVSFSEYLQADPNKIYRILQYKRMFTPYEESQKFMDESQFVDDRYTLVQIAEVLSLPNDDLMLVCKEVYKDCDSDEIEYDGFYRFYKLSEIEISIYEGDNDNEFDD